MKKFVAAVIITLALTTQGYPLNTEITPPSAISLTEVNPYRIEAAESSHPTTKAAQAMETSYEGTPVEKISDGVTNMATSWADVPAKIAEVSEKDNLFLGVTLGLGEGLVSGVARGVSGAADTATFAAPPYNKPLMKPEYKVENPDQGFKVDILKW